MKMRHYVKHFSRDPVIRWIAFGTVIVNIFCTILYLTIPHMNENGLYSQCYFFLLDIIYISMLMVSVSSNNRYIMQDIMLIRCGTRYDAFTKRVKLLLFECALLSAVRIFLYIIFATLVAEPLNFMLISITFITQMLGFTFIGLFLLCGYLIFNNMIPGILSAFGFTILDQIGYSGRHMYVIQFASMQLNMGGQYFVGNVTIHDILFSQVFIIIKIMFLFALATIIISRKSVREAKA